MGEGARSGFFKEEAAEFKCKIQNIVSGKLYHIYILMITQSFFGVSGCVYFFAARHWGIGALVARAETPGGEAGGAL